MPQLTDHQLMSAAESTWGTPVTVSRAVPILPDSSYDWDQTRYEGQGLHVSSPGGVLLSARAGAGIGAGTIAPKFELFSKGLGLWLNAWAGTSTVTLVSGTTWQHVHTFISAGTVLPAQTVQAGIVDNTGTLRPHTFAGVTVGSGELEIPPGPDGLAMLSLDCDAKSIATATAAGTWTPATGFTTFGGYSTASVITIGGAITAPTTTALGSSSGTVTTAIKRVKLSYGNNIDKARWTVGGRNQPTVGRREPALELDYEFGDVTQRDAIISQASQALLVDLQTSEALSSGNARFQLVIPDFKLEPGGMPGFTSGETVVQQLKGKIFWNLTQSPVYLVMRTADAAL